MLLHELLETTARRTPETYQAHQWTLESFMVPKHVAIVAELPKTDTGKIEKTG